MLWRARIVALLFSLAFFVPTHVFAANTLLQVSVFGGVTSICNDGIDNDSDGLTDYPADPGCTGATDEDEFNAAPVVPTSTPVFGGGPIVGSPSVALASAVFSGVAYPGSFITLLKDGVLLSVSPVNVDGSFTINLNNIAPGTYTFTLYTKDERGALSEPYQIPLNVVGGLTTTVSGIYLAPTIFSDKLVVAEGHELTIEGYARPDAEVALVIVSPVGSTRLVALADENGKYVFSIDTTEYPQSLYNAYTTFFVREVTEIRSKIISFTVGRTDVVQSLSDTCGRFDLDGDCRVSLVDFSIMAFWYKKPNPPAKDDLNGDGVVDLVDLSILITKWTG